MLINGASYCLAIFFTCFNVGHWIFAMQYWVLSFRLKWFVEGTPNQTPERWVIYTVGVLGLLANLTSGVLIVLAFHHQGSLAYENITEVFNIAPNFVALIILCDALRRLRNIAKGVLSMETWQMIWHFWSFFLVMSAGVILSVMTHHAWQHSKEFYVSYGLIVVMIFACELPFIYILNKISNTIQKPKKTQELEPEEPESDTTSIN